MVGYPHRLSYYRRIAERRPPQVIYYALGPVKEANREGRVTWSRGALFAVLITRFGAINLDSSIASIAPSSF